MIFMVVAMLALLFVLAALGAVVFRLQLRDPVALLTIGFGFALFASGLHLLSSSLAKSDRSASFVGGVVVLLLSLVGGTFVPAEQYPPFLRAWPCWCRTAPRSRDSSTCWSTSAAPHWAAGWQ